jgi:hypothetical protein
MRKFTEQTVKYLGYSKPMSKQEIEFEILSIENLIRKLQFRTSELKKNMYIADLATAKGATNMEELFGDSHENIHNKDGKREEDTEGNKTRS